MEETVKVEVKPKKKREMTPEMLEKLAIARQKALDAKKKIREGGEKAKLEVLEKKLNKLKSKNTLIDLSTDEKILEAEEKSETTEPEKEEVEEPEEPKPEPPKKPKKKNKKPVVIVQEDDSESEDDNSNVIYIQPRRRPKARNPQPPMAQPTPVYQPQPPPRPRVPLRPTKTASEIMRGNFSTG